MKALKPSTQRRLRKALVGAQLQWIDSWADGIIKTINYGKATSVTRNVDAIIEATCGWRFNWSVEYIYYCKDEFGCFYDMSYEYKENNTTINLLQDIINENVKKPARERLNQKHIYDEGWIETILG
jgi:hypothetical protein